MSTEQTPNPPAEIQYTLQDIFDAVQYGFAYREESQHDGFVPVGNILQWIMYKKCLEEIPEEFKKFK